MQIENILKIIGKDYVFFAFSSNEPKHKAQNNNNLKYSMRKLLSTPALRYYYLQSFKKPVV